jgi:hypothetical protein
MNLNAEILEAALIGLEMKKARLEEQIASIRSMARVKTPRKSSLAATDDWEAPMGMAPKKAAKGKKKRVMSPEARERIAAAQKKRWAAHRGEAV